MSDGRSGTDPSEGSKSPRPSRVDPLHAAFVQLQAYPELIPVVRQAVDQVLANSNINQERVPDLVEDVEGAAAAAALAVYEQLGVTVSQVSGAAEEARRAQADAVAARAEVIAERVTDAAAEVLAVEEAAADYRVLIAAKVASDLAGSVTLNDETAALAAALVVNAVRDAAAVSADAVAESASIVAQAAADAAADTADAAEQAASSALAAERELLTNARDSHKTTLEACFKVAAATAQAILNYLSRADLLQARVDSSASTKQLDR